MSIIYPCRTQSLFIRRFDQKTFLGRCWTW